MQHYTIKLIYHNNPFPRWVVGDKDFGALADSEDKVIAFLIKNIASSDQIEFKYVNGKPAEEDFENMFFESLRAKVQSKK